MARRNLAHSWRYWSLLATAVLVLKLFVYSADPYIGFFLGDSATYLLAAINYGIPVDRSHVFGFFVRLATLNLHSLDALVVIQVLISTVTCLLLAFILIEFFHCSALLSAAAGMLCAVEPVQTLFERYLMAETTSLGAFALSILFLLFYQRHGSLRWLVAAAVLGSTAVSLRTAYLPAALATGLAATAWYAVFGIGRDWAFRRHDAPATSRRRPWCRASPPLVFAAVLLGLTSANTALKPFPTSGFFLLAAWSPAVDAEVISRNPLLRELTTDIPCDLQDRHQRLGQLFAPDCLVTRIKTHFNDPIAANRFANKVAIDAALTNPETVAELGVQTWLSFWDDSSLEGILDYDTGVEVMSEDILDMVQTHFGTDITGWEQRETVTKQYYEDAVWWHRWVVASPLLAVVWWLLTLRRLTPYSLVIVVGGLGLLVAETLPVTISSIRFFHGIAWLSIIPLVSSIDQLTKLHRLGKTPPHWTDHHGPTPTGFH